MINTINNDNKKKHYICIHPKKQDFSTEDIEEFAQQLIEAKRESTGLSNKHIVFFLMTNKIRYKEGTLERFVFEKAIDLIEDIRKDGELE